MKTCRFKFTLHVFFKAAKERDKIMVQLGQVHDGLLDVIEQGLGAKDGGFLSQVGKTEKH